MSASNRSNSSGADVDTVAPVMVEEAAAPPTDALVERAWMCRASIRPLVSNYSEAYNTRGLQGALPIPITGPDEERERVGPSWIWARSTVGTRAEAPMGFEMLP